MTTALGIELDGARRHNFRSAVLNCSKNSRQNIVRHTRPDFCPPDGLPMGLRGTAGPLDFAARLGGYGEPYPPARMGSGAIGRGGHQRTHAAGAAATGKSPDAPHDCRRTMLMSAFVDPFDGRGGLRRIFTFLVHWRSWHSTAIGRY